MPQNAAFHKDILHYLLRQKLSSEKEMQYYFRVDATKPVFGVSDQVMLKEACSAAETSRKSEILIVTSVDMMLSNKQITNALIRLCMHRYVFAFGVLKLPKTDFLASRPIRKLYPMTARCKQWTIPSLFYQTRRKDLLIYKGLSTGVKVELILYFSWRSVCS